MCWEADFPRIRLVTQDSDFLGLLWTVMPASLIVHCTHCDSFCPHFSLRSSAHYWLSPDLSVGQSSEDWPVCVLIIGGKQAVLSPFWQSVSGFPATSEPSVVDCVTSSYSDSFIKAVIWRGDREVQTQVPLKWQLSVGHPRSHLVSKSPGVALPLSPHTARTSHWTLLLPPLPFLSPTSSLPFWKDVIPFSCLFLFLCPVFSCPPFFSTKTMLWNGPQK